MQQAGAEEDATPREMEEAEAVRRCRELIQAKCSVPVSALSLHPPCVHAQRALDQSLPLPPPVNASILRGTVETRRADRLLAVAAAEEAGLPLPPPLPPIPDSAPRLTCAACEGEYEGEPDRYCSSHVVALPGWETSCRQHAWREASRTRPGERIFLIPRGSDSVLWCPVCCCGIVYRTEQLEPTMQGVHLPPPEFAEGVRYWPTPRDVSTDGAEVETGGVVGAVPRGSVLVLAQLAAEVRQWKHAALCRSPSGGVKLRRVFVPPGGLDPAGDESEWTQRFYSGVLTSGCTLPHARLVAQGEERCAVILREHDKADVKANKNVFGYALEADAEEPDAAPLHERLALLDQLPIRYDLQVRSVWLHDSERWADCIVAHQPGAEEVEGHTVPEDWYTGVLGEEDADEEEEGEEEGGAAAVMSAAERA
eukprot:Hpha_TRINITY_DN14925_c1_g2::TRINITY_DN14925_c1_g2_i1::g.145027::m.145027